MTDPKSPGGLDWLSDAEILQAIGTMRDGGGFFSSVAWRLGVGCAEDILRGRLRKLEKKGLLRRCPDRGNAKRIFWIRGGAV